MSLTNRWGRQNPLIRRVRQHGALTTLFRTVDERTPALPFAIGVPLTAPVTTPAPLEEEWTPVQQPLADQAMPAPSRPIATPAPPTPTAAGELVGPPVAPPVVMRATQPTMAVQPSLAPPVDAPLLPLPSRPASPPPLPGLTGKAVVSQPDTPTVSMDIAGGDAPPALPPSSSAASAVTMPPASLPPTPTPMPAPSTSTPAQRQPATIQRTPAAQQQPATDGMDEATWSRLRAIVRKHQVREAAEGAPEAKAAMVTPTADSSMLADSHPLPQVLNSASALPAVTSSPSPVAHTPPGAPAPTVQPAAYVAAQPAALPQAWENLEPIASADPLPATGSTTSHQPLAGTGVQRQPLASSGGDAPLPQPSPATSMAQWHAIRDDGEPNEASSVSADDLPASAAAGVDPAAAPGWSAVALSQPPLQAVWPVQRLAETGAEPATAPTDLPAYVGPPPPEPPELRRQLAALPTAQPTDSSVDLVLPRRPRPVRQPATNVAPSQGAPTAAQRQLASSAEGTPPAATSLPGATIATEIGPLPADLWQLIGEKPPQAAAPTINHLPPPVQKTPDSPTAIAQNELSVPTVVDAPPPLVPQSTPVNGDAFVTAPPTVTSGVGSAAAMVMRQVVPVDEAESADTDFSVAASPESYGAVAEGSPPEKKTRSPRRTRTPAKRRRRRTPA